MRILRLNKPLYIHEISSPRLLDSVPNFRIELRTGIGTRSSVISNTVIIYLYKIWSKYRKKICGNSSNLLIFLIFCENRINHRVLNTSESSCLSLLSAVYPCYLLTKTILLECSQPANNKINFFLCQDCLWAGHAGSPGETAEWPSPYLLVLNAASSTLASQSLSLALLSLYIYTYIYMCLSIYPSLFI